MALPFESNIVNRRARPDAGDDVLELAAGRLVEQHVIGDNRLYFPLNRKVGNLVQPHLIVRPSAQVERNIGPISENFGHPSELDSAGLIREIGNKHAEQALGVECNVFKVQNALRLAAARLAEGQQPRQTRIGRTIRRVDQDRHAVLQIKATADNQPQACGTRCLQRPDDTGQAVAVDDAKSFDADELCGREQFLSRACAPEEREMRGDLKFGVAHQAKTPCRNHRCDPVSASTPSPDR
ncbi:hypothetical protein GGE56_005914 [Rhizobium leguminosarum]|nr:hypothetical protein [Rhizobium leguminosarum]MBB6297588.1 hypothetical protein [Rhizobium leguminosarum]